MPRLCIMLRDPRHQDNFWCLRLRDVRWLASVWCYDLAMRGTERSYAYALCGTELAYGATSWRSQSWQAACTSLSLWCATLLRAPYAMPATSVLYVVPYAATKSDAVSSTDKRVVRY
eukprot:703883-Rhodomonas_salina.2